jgi:hypothetical protein
LSLPVEGAEFRNEGEVRGAFRALGAVGAASAQPGKYFGVGTQPFERLLRTGVVREGTPGNFYLYEQKVEGRRIVRLVVFWIVVILLPILIIQLSGHSGK